MGEKDPGEYWQGGVKDGPIPELIQGLVDVSKVTSVSTTKNHCHTSTKRSQPTHHHGKLNANTSYQRDFEPKPNISSYNDAAKPKGEKSFKKDFEPRPNISAYDDDAKLRAKRSFKEDFEPRPNISAYTDEDKVEEKKSFVKDFEPRPNISAYGDDESRQK
ncbi:UNVERIFIED_CONTAM: hypothetical protein Sradi_2804900 [Sesamum radiatum]|uniref:Organ-specific protein S2 n=1 Tax=Sesamum radiatum TaxID=300843 RepID=A0AAW2RXB6_SESRA